MWKNRKKRRKIKKSMLREQVSSEIHIEDFKLLINGEPVPATKFVLTEKFIHAAWDSEKIPKMDITVEITLEKENSDGSEKIKHDGIITRRKIEASGGEKPVEVNNPMSSRSGMKTSDDSKPPEPRCGICKYELSLIEDVPCNSCNMYELDKFEPREDENHES